MQTRSVPRQDQDAETGSGGWPGWSWLPTSPRTKEILRRSIREGSTSDGFDPRVAEALRATLLRAVEEDAEWLSHPSLARLYVDDPRLAPEASLESRLATFGWILQHMTPTELSRVGRFEITVPTFVWTPAGAEGLVPRVYDAFDLVDELRRLGSCEVPAVPDPWCDAIPREFEESAQEFSDATFGSTTRHRDPAEAEALVTNAVRALLRSQSVFRRLVPRAARWVGNVAHVVVPLHGGERGSFRSGSLSSVPGVVFVEVTDLEVLMLEALVHESAHLHFYRAEHGSPLVGGTGHERFVSPLRSDERPLRGIFLAYHALLYMASFYEEWAHAGGRRYDKARAELVEKRDEAEATLAGATDLLTERGRTFLDRCRALARATTDETSLTGGPDDSRNANEL